MLTLRRPHLPLLICSLALLSAACASPMNLDYPPGGTYYSQFSVRYEKGRYPTTNYRRGLLLPINTEVELIAVNSRQTKLIIKNSGSPLLVQNMAKHTGKDMATAFEEMFAAQPVDLSSYSDEQRTAIEAGKALTGMHKADVLLALGPPPASGTPSQESSSWKYWSSRWSTFLVAFDEAGVATEIGE